MYYTYLRHAAIRQRAPVQYIPRPSWKGPLRGGTGRCELSFRCGMTACAGSGVQLAAIARVAEARLDGTSRPVPCDGPDMGSDPAVLAKRRGKPPDQFGDLSSWTSLPYVDDICFGRTATARYVEVRGEA